MLERGLLRMDPERHTCTWKNEPVTLTVTEFLILQALASRPGVVKSRNALMDAAYDDQVYVDDRTIDSHIKRLRKKFKAVDDDFDMIETLYGVGYRFKEAVTTALAADRAAWTCWPAGKGRRLVRSDGAGCQAPQRGRACEWAATTRQTDRARSNRRDSSTTEA